MSVKREDYLGVGVAVLGAGVTIGTMVMLAQHRLESNALATLLTLAGVGLVALGMYVVVPTTAKAAIHDLSSAAERMKPLYGRRVTDETGDSHVATISPRPDTTVVVDRPQDNPVSVPPVGDPVEIDGPPPPPLPAPSTPPPAPSATEVIGLVPRRGASDRRGTKRGVPRRSDDLYPSGDA